MTARYAHVVDMAKKNPVLFIPVNLGQVGQAARADDEPAVARQVVDDLAHQADDAALADDLEIVEEEREPLGLDGEQVDHAAIVSLGAPLEA